MKRFVALLLLLGSLLAQPVPQTPPLNLSPQVYAIAKTLRCPVCQGESVASSSAGLAAEMRQIIAQKLAQGWSEAQIQQYFERIYGPFILYKPPFSGLNIWVWLSPLLALAVLGGSLFAYVRAARRRASKLQLSEEELARAEEELKGSA
jgi:cytochrome c-type biogenesis protein CcmH